MDLSMSCRIVDLVNELQATERLAHARQLVTSGAARRIRRAADLSLAEVSRAVGVDLSTVGRWERRERVPRGAAALRYAELLHRLQKQATEAREEMP
jgi:DNA-binding transcriptional regulator YiaG